MPVFNKKWLFLVSLFAGAIYLALQWGQFVSLSILENRPNVRLGYHPIKISPAKNTRVPKNRKVAVLIPYTGSSLPSWFRSFMFTAQLSSDILDWYIFVTEPKDIATPSNVHIIYVPESELFSRIVRMDPRATIDGNVSLYFWRDKLADTVKIFSYLLVEFKPCLGFIFQDYIKDYSHWAYADVDMLVGRASAFITKDLIDLYDIYTSSFGDTNRMYMRGQLTIIRNSIRVNDLWRKCQYFPTLTHRIESFLATYPKHAHTRSKGWRLYSAEGCISRVFVDEPGVSIVVDPTQISDAFRAHNSERESFLLGSALLRCYEEPIDLVEVARTKYLEVPPHRLPYAGNPSLPVVRAASPDCANWIDKNYQVCLEGVTRDAYISWRGYNNSTFVRMNYDTPNSKVTIPHPDLPRCREGIISHFQGWKREYYHFTTRPPSLHAHMLLLSRDGFIPLTIPSLTFQLPSIGDSLRQHYGLLPLSLSGGAASSAEYEAKGGGEVFTGNEKQGLYCLRFKSDLKSCVSFLQPSDILVRRKVVPQARAVRVVGRDKNSPTLIVAGSVEDVIAGDIDASITTWNGNKIIVIQHSGTYDDMQEFISRTVGDGPFHSIEDYPRKATTTEEDKSSEWQITLVLVNVTTTNTAVLDKMLYNIGLDVAPSDIVVVCPPGMQIQAGSSSYLTQVLSFPTDKPMAIVLPPFVLPGNVEWKDMASKSPEAYPFEQGMNRTIKHCGQQQPRALRLNYTTFVELTSSGRSIPLSTDSAKKKEVTAYIAPNSALIPVAFNRKDNLHGDRFIRFPEELNGQFCFSSSLLATLAGSGYVLHWTRYISLTSRAQVERTYARSCHCAYAYDRENKPYAEFIENYLRFLLRATELRENGIQKLYASEPFSGEYT